MKNNLFIDYQLFGEGEGAEGSTTAATGTQNKQEQLSEQTNSNDFDSFINSHKDEFNARVESIIKDRINKIYARTGKIKSEYDEAKPILDILKSRYKVESYSDLQKCIDNDNALWEQEANSCGMDVEQYKDFIRTKNENATLRAAQAEAERQRGEQEFLQRVYNQAVVFKNENANFDLKAELESNPTFIRLLQTGIDVKTAYNACHINDIVTNAQMAAAQQAQAEMAKNIQSRNGVPAEAGLGASSAVDENIDLASLSDEEFLKRYNQIRKRG